MDEEVAVGVGEVSSAAACTSVGVIVHHGSRVGWRRGTLQVFVLVLVMTVGSTLNLVLVIVPRVLVFVVVTRFGVVVMVFVLVKAGEVTTLVEVLMLVSHEVMVLLTIGVMIAVIVAVGV